MTSYRQSMKDTLQIMYDVREASLLERDLTPDEEKRREEIAKDLPDDDFKKRYGDKWKSVKMATATKMMKKEEVDLDEGVIDKVKEVASKKQAMKIDGVMVDTFTASAISQIYDKVNDANKKKMDSLPITKLANLAMKMMQKNEFVPEEVELDEDGHTDVSSAVRKCMTITEDAQDINSKLRTMSPEDSLPSWWTNKLAIASNDMNKMRDYIVNPVQEEVELDEKMSPSDQDRLDDLLMAYRWGKSSYGFDDYGFDDYNDIPNPDDVVKLIRKEFGNKIADQLVKSDDKIKVGRGGGPSDRKTPTRITKKGKANKADLNALKTRLKKKRDWDKIAPKGKLPEEVVDEGKMQDMWQKKNAKSLSVGPFELLRGKSGVHTIKQSGKVIGDFSYDSDADNFVANMKGMKGQWTGNDIDSLFTHLQKVHKEEVEIDEEFKKGDKVTVKVAKSSDREIQQLSKKFGDTVSGVVMGQSGKILMVKTDKGQINPPVKDVMKEEVEVEESKTTVPMSTKAGQSVKKGQVPKGMYGNAARDARRAMGRDPEMRQRAFSKDDSATDDDKKAASKNIMVQMRKAQSLGYFDVEFQDGKKIKIPAKLAIAVQQKYNAMRKPSDKEKFQAKIGKSYRDMLNALKEEAVSPAQQAAIAISKKERGEKPKKESILDRIDRKIKENKNG